MTSADSTCPLPNCEDHHPKAEDIVRRLLADAIAAKAATWEETFPSGEVGQVVGVQDAAHVASQHIADVGATAQRLRRQRDLALARENAACQTAGTHAEREGAAAADLAALRVLARELSGFARFHAMHSEVSPGDRARIAELCDLVENGLGPIYGG